MGEKQQIGTQAKYFGLLLMDIHWKLPWQNASSNSRGFYLFSLILKSYLNFFVYFRYCLMEGKTSVCLFFFLQTMAPTDPFDSSKHEMEGLEEELKKWKASSVKHRELWKLAERYFEVL